MPSKLSEAKSLSLVWLFATPWTIQFMEFSRPENWSGYYPFSSGSCRPRNQTRSPALQDDSLPTELSRKLRDVFKTISPSLRKKEEV